MVEEDEIWIHQPLPGAWDEGRRARLQELESEWSPPEEWARHLAVHPRCVILYTYLMYELITHDLQ